MNICIEKEDSWSKNTNIILKKDSCQLPANDRALIAFYVKCVLCKDACVYVFVCEREISLLINKSAKEEESWKIKFLNYFNMQENEVRKEKKKKENICFMNRCRHML